MTATPLSPGDLLSRYPHFSPYPTAAFLSPPASRANKKKKKWKLDTTSFMPRSGSGGKAHKSESSTAARSISASVAPILQRPPAREQTQRTASGPQQQQQKQKRRAKQFEHTYIVTADESYRRYQDQLDGRHYHYDRLMHEKPATQDWEEWQPRNYGINERTRIVELDSDAPESTLHKPTKIRRKVQEGIPLYASTSSASSSQLSVSRKPIAASHPSTPGYIQTPTSLLEVYLDTKAREHPAETERQVRAGAVVSAHNSPYQSRPVSPELRTPIPSPTKSILKYTGRRDSYSRITASSVYSQEQYPNSIYSRTQSNLPIVEPEAIGSTTEPLEQRRQSLSRPRPHLLLDPSTYLSLIHELVEEGTKTENREKLKRTGIVAAKMVVILYLASCTWNVLTAVRDAILKALEPVIAILGFLSWMIGKSR